MVIENVCVNIENGISDLEDILCGIVFKCENKRN
jgi:hypothetical protein